MFWSYFKVLVFVNYQDICVQFLHIILRYLHFFLVFNTLDWDVTCKWCWGKTIHVTIKFSELLNSKALQWRHNEHDGVSNRQRLDCIPNRFFRRRSQKTLKLRVTGLCEGNSPVTGEFPEQMASNAENDSILWHHDGVKGYKLHQMLGHISVTKMLNCRKYRHTHEENSAK